MCTFSEGPLWTSKYPQVCVGLSQAAHLSGLQVISWLGMEKAVGHWDVAFFEWPEKSDPGQISGHLEGSEKGDS